MSMFTEEDLAGLSEAEREIVRELSADDADVRGDAESADADQGGAAADAVDAAGEAGGDAGQDGVADEAPAAADADADEAGDAADGTAGQDDVPAPPVTLQAVTPDDAQEQRHALRIERATALQQLLDGEIDQQAYQDIEARVQDKLDDLARAAAVDMARAQMQQDAMVAEYGQHLGAVQKELAAAGIDLAGDAGAQLDRAIRLFAQEAVERGLVDAAGNMAASREALAEAKALVLRRFAKAPAPVAAAPAPAAPPQPAVRKPAPADRSTLPPTLAGVPAAADASVGNEFAHLDGLEGSALERALARMTPDQQDRYLGA